MSDAVNPVRDVRTALKYTQEQMAAELECSYMTVRRSEYQRRMPQTKAVVNRLRRLAKRAGVSIEAEAVTK